MATARIWALSKSKMQFLVILNWQKLLEMVILQSHFSTSLKIIQVTSKSAILIGDVLENDDDIFGKRGSNVTCCKKPHPIWPNGLEDMAF
jgi:hypothetical protein